MSKNPRGIRNNNPGNINKGIGFQGEIQGDDSRFATFETPEMGIRALAKNLITYDRKYGLNTPQAIINRWAPSNENNTNAYVNVVSKALGVNPTDKLNMRDPAVMAKLASAIIQHENGQNPYSAEQINAGVNMALGSVSTPNMAKVEQREPGLVERFVNAVIPSAQAAEVIDPNKVVWDEEPIDPTKVVWDEEPTAQSQTPLQPSQQQEPVKDRGFFEKVGDFAMDVPRQVGLTARYGLEGIGQSFDVVTEPIRNYITDPALRALGLIDGSSQSSSSAMKGIADYIGLPTPQNSTERVVGDITRLMAGTAVFGGGANALGNMTNSKIAQTTLKSLGANPGAQMSSAIGSGLLGGSVREAGGSDTAQTVASVAGGLLGPMALSGVQRVGRGIKQMAPVSEATIDKRLAEASKRADVNWDDMPGRIKSALRTHAKQAISGDAELDGDALRRMVEFQKVGATPTRGTLSLDPAQITRERNLAKLGANAGDSSLNSLSQIESNNNRVLINALNDRGANAVDDIYSVGHKAISNIDDQIAARKAKINSLYNAARDSTGRSAPLNGGYFTEKATRLLYDAMLGGQLPNDVRNHLNKIAMGEVPFDVHYAEQLKTRIGQLQRATNDGSVRLALGIVRQALDDTPLQSGVASQFGDEAIAAFNKARQANRNMMQWVESSPALKAVYL